MTKAKAFLKWAGSKYNCLSQILSSLPSAGRLVEPFTGSAVIFLNTNYPSYLLAEINQDLIDIFTMLQSQGKDFIEYCQQYFQNKYNSTDQYYELRTRFNALYSSRQKSAIFLYLNRHGYNGLCRYNSKGIYNVPFGLYPKPYFPHQEMINFHHKSQRVEFICNDFRSTFDRAEKGDILYCDPPYVPLTEKKRAFSYNKNIFTLDDHIELAELARETAAKGIPVIISNHDTPFTQHHYRKAKIKSFLVSRFINCKVNQREPVKELVALFE